MSNRYVKLDDRTVTSDSSLKIGEKIQDCFTCDNRSYVKRGRNMEVNCKVGRFKKENKKCSKHSDNVEKVDKRLDFFLN